MFERLSARGFLLTCEFTFACAGDIRLQSSWSHGWCLHLAICFTTRRRLREQAAGCLFGVAWQLLPPVTHAPTRHLNWEVQIMGTRWTLGGHTSDTRWTQRWTHDGHCENTAFCARPRTSNSRTKQVPKGCIRFLVFLQCPSSVHRCVHRASAEGPSLCPSLPGLKLAVKSYCADVCAVESRAEKQT